jgi:S1-C subfamily serine protease
LKKWNLILSVMLVVSLVLSGLALAKIISIDKDLRDAIKQAEQLNGELKNVNEKLASLESKDFDFTKIYAEAKKAMVTVGGATGFLYLKNTQVVTSFHVIAELPPDKIVEVLPNDGVSLLRRGKIKFIKPEWDLAVIELDEAIDAKPLMPADIISLVGGEKVLVIGNPEGLKNSLSAGVISGLAIRRSPPFVPLIQIDASIDRGSSGGPVINKNGEVIGVISKALWNLTFGFAIPIDKVDQLIEEESKK